MRVIRRELLVHPTQVQNDVDLPNQMIGRHHPVQIKRIKKLTLSAFPSTHHDPLLRIIAHSTESRVVSRFNQSFATQYTRQRTTIGGRLRSALCHKPKSN
jgi:hypothetical protein